MTAERQTEKRTIANQAVVKKAAARATRASAKLENREVPEDFTPRVLGVTVHAETVRIRPFADGNSRTTRLLADLVYIAAQERANLQYDWDVDKTRYIQLLREFDVRRNADELVEFIGVQLIES